MMKGLTVWQPWAFLLGCGAKKYETRSWETRYRGTIAIHAAAKEPCAIMRSLSHDVQKAMFDCLYAILGIQSGALEKMPIGAVIATAELIGCHYIMGAVPTKHIYVGSSLYTAGPSIKSGAKLECITGNELLFGYWEQGRYAWEFANMRMLPTPIPYKGAQGLWNIDEQTIMKCVSSGGSQ